VYDISIHNGRRLTRAHTVQVGPRRYGEICSRPPVLREKIAAAVLSNNEKKQFASALR